MAPTVEMEPWTIVHPTDHQPIRLIILGDLKSISLQDAPKLIFEDAIGSKIDWTKSFQGLSSEPFPKEVADILQSPVNPEDIEIEPGILLYWKTGIPQS